MVKQHGRRGGVSPLGDALLGFLRDAKLDRRLREAEVFAAWRATLGPQLAERAVAVRFEQGELTVEVASAALLGELKGFTGERHRENANVRLGAPRIHSVSFKPRR